MLLYLLAYLKTPTNLSMFTVLDLFNSPPTERPVIYL